MKRFLFSAGISLLLVIPQASCSTQKPAVKTIAVPQRPESRVKRYDDPEINAIIRGAWNSYTNARYEQSLLDFNRLIVKGYTHYDVLFGAGCANMKYYDLKKALSFFDRCISGKKDHFEALFFRAEIYRQMKDFPRARADLEAILAIETTSPVICGLYPGEYSDRSALAKRKIEASAILKTM
jgi:tetratricopeptide (TPR) repeat protein